MQQTLRLSLAALLLSTAVVAGSLPATAQLTNNPSTSADPNQGVGSPSDTSADLLNNTSGGMNSVMDLIHRANLGGLQNSADFQRSQQNNIRTQAEQFRARQQELLRQQQQPQQQPAPANTTPSPAP